MSKPLKDTYKDDWERFRDPVKQEIKNLRDSIKYGIQDTIADMQDEKTRPKGGCFKKVVLWAIIIIVICALANSCSDNDNDRKENSTSSAQTQATETTRNETEPSGTSASTEESDDTPFLYQQTVYAKNHNIDLKKFPKEQKKIVAAINALDDASYCYVSVDNVLGSERYKATTEPTEYIYGGTTKENYADGIGILLKLSKWNSSEEETTGFSFTYLNGKPYDIAYIGNFKDGRLDGYGFKYHIPTQQEFSIFRSICTKEELWIDEIHSYYQAWLNYVEYDGMFADGKRDGEGNSYETDLEIRSYAAAVGQKFDIKNAEYDTVTVGTFKNDKKNGKCKIYTVGVIDYDGEMKNNERNGSGNSYDKNGNLIYKGDFKNDMKDGKGTLYDTNGKVIYNGSWKEDDYK